MPTGVPGTARGARVGGVEPWRLGRPPSRGSQVAPTLEERRLGSPPGRASRSAVSGGLGRRRRGRRRVGGEGSEPVAAGAAAGAAAGPWGPATCASACPGWSLPPCVLVRVVLWCRLYCCWLTFFKRIIRWGDIGEYSYLTFRCTLSFDIGTFCVCLPPRVQFDPLYPVRLPRPPPPPARCSPCP